MLMTLLATERLIGEAAAKLRTVVSLKRGVLLETTVSASCFRPSAVCVAYVELMSAPPTCSAVALTVPKVVVPWKVFKLEMV